MLRPLLQIYMAGFMPQAALGAATIAVAAAALVNGAKLSGALAAMPGGGDAWALWTEVLGLIGLVILPQVGHRSSTMGLLVYRFV